MKWSHNYRNFAVLLYLLIGFSPILNSQLPAGFIDETINGSWQYPAGITFANNGQGYIWDNNGVVYVLNTDGQLLASPLFNIREQVVRFLDQGMLGFVLDPDFLENGYCYALYTADPHHWKTFGTADYDPTFSQPYQGTIGRISRFTADAATGFRQIIPGSQLVLVGKTAADGFPLLFESHSVGSLVFGADGSLLASCGDGASSTSIDIGSNPQTYYQEGLESGIIRPNENVGVFRAQMISSLSGKVIRIDPATGDGLGSNPYYDSSRPRAARSRVWAMGLRNPFRMLSVPGTGGHGADDPGWFLLGDVGEGSWEEINLLQRGGQNFGWPFLEGFEPHPQYSNQLVPHPDYADFCEEAPSFPTIYSQAGIPDCCPDCLGFFPSTPRLAYRNRWNELSQPEILLAQDSSMNAAGVRPADASYAFSGNLFLGDASIGGCFYTGTSYPEAYQGKYFHADFRNWIRVFSLNLEGNMVAVDSFYTGVKKVVSLAMNPLNGFLYYTSMDDQALHCLRYGGPRSAKAIIQADQSWGNSPLVVSFDGSQSEGASNQLSYEWTFGESQQSNLPNPSFTFSTNDDQPTAIPVQLVVRDSLGQRDTALIQIVVNGRSPEVHIVTPQIDLHYPTIGTYPILARAAVIDAHTPDDQLDFDWTLLLYHEDHTHVASNSSEVAPQFLISPLGCGEENYFYELVLNVTNAQGLSATDQRRLYPDCEGSDWVSFEYIRLLPNADGFYQLEWQTGREQDVASFVIEAGNEVFTFSELMSIPAENILAGSSYDLSLPAEASSYRLFRIRAINETPAFRLSPMAIAENGNTANFAQLIQQPVVEELQLNISNVVSRRQRITLFDVRGRQLSFAFQDALIGQASMIRLDVSSLIPGMYYYQLEDGPRVQWGRFVKA